MKIFDTQPKPGMPVRHGAFYRAITRMARAWEGLAVDGGHVSWSGGKPTIVIDGDGGGEAGHWATDYVFVGGKKLTIPENGSGYSYLKVYLDGTTAPEWVETLPDEQSEDYEVFDMVSLPHIHLPGNFAG